MDRPLNTPTSTLPPTYRHWQYMQPYHYSTPPSFTYYTASQYGAFYGNPGKPSIFTVDPQWGWLFYLDARGLSHTKYINRHIGVITYGYRELNVNIKENCSPEAHQGEAKVFDIKFHDSSATIIVKTNFWDSILIRGPSYSNGMCVLIRP